MKRRIKRIYKKGKITQNDAGAVMSYHGWITNSNSYKIHQKYVRPYINMKECKQVLKNQKKILKKDF